MECSTPKPRNRPEMGGFYSHLVVEDPRILVARTQWQTKQMINRKACFGPVASLGKQQYLIIYVSEIEKVHHLGMTLYIKHHLWRLAEWSQGCKTLATK